MKRKYTYGYSPLAAAEDYALPDTRSVDPQAGQSERSSQSTPAATRKGPGTRLQGERELRQSQQALPTRLHHRSQLSPYHRRTGQDCLPG
jgi:hypothetical protein